MTNTLREMREKKQLTVLELSRASGVSRQTIYNIENNKSPRVSSDVMEALAKALKVKVGSIFFF